MGRISKLKMDLNMSMPEFLERLVRVDPEEIRLKIKSAPVSPDNVKKKPMKNRQPNHSVGITSSAKRKRKNAKADRKGGTKSPKVKR